MFVKKNFKKSLFPGIEARDAILVAIREDYVDGVETLLIYEEESHKEGDPYSWEKVDQVREKP